jgi:hypothetical protein
MICTISIELLFAMISLWILVLEEFKESNGICRHLNVALMFILRRPITI